MNVTPGESRHFVTMRVTKKNENFECISFNPMAFHAGKSTVDRIEVKPMVCENIRTIGSINTGGRMLLSGFFSDEKNLFWKCFPASPDSYFGLLPLMVFPMPMMEGVTYLGGSDTIAVELVFFLSYLDHQYAYLNGGFKNQLSVSSDVSELSAAVEAAAVKAMSSSQYATFLKQLEEARSNQQFKFSVTEVNHGSPVQLDLW